MTRIHILRDMVLHDRQTGAVSCVIGVETHGEPKRYGRVVSILGPSVVKYAPTDPMASGATVYIETDSDVVVN